MDFKDRFRQIVIISFFISILINILGLIFLPSETIFREPRALFVLTMVAVFTLSVLISFILAAAYIFFSSLDKQAHIEVSHKKSFEEGGVKSKQIHRTLEEYEKELLSQLYKKTRNKNYDLDRRSAVFKVQGKLYKQPGRADPYVEIPERWFVKGVEINENNYPPIRFKIFSEEEEIVVEFSPYSGYVWDVYKVYGGHRNWFLYLAPEIFNQVATGEIKMVGRAPYGNHNLEEIKTGDIITFTQLTYGRRIDVKVERIRAYKTLKDMVDSEGVENLLPQAKTIEEVTSFYSSLFNYRERIKKGGIYSLRINLLNQ